MQGTRRLRDLRKHLRSLSPLIPYADAEDVLMRAAHGSLRSLPPSVSIWLALTSHVRHRYTDYDALLAEGYDRDAARHFTLDATDDTLLSWGCGRSVVADVEAEQA
jgi:hypothetical protein